MLRRFAILLISLAVLAVGPAWAFFSLTGFQNSMIEFLIDQLSTEGELEIKVEEVAEDAEGESLLRGLSIADSEGVWFTAETIDFAWDPSRLLSGEVEFSRLRMTGVRVLRPPVVPPSEAPPEPEDPDAPLIPEIAWPRSPLTMRVDGLALTDVRIAEPVLGHALAFDATGALRDEGDEQSARLALTRTDAVRGEITLDYVRNFADSTLKLIVTAEEGPEGLIAALSGLPPEATSSLSLEADGPPEDWRLALDLTLAETVAADGTARISYRGPVAVEADFRARPGPRLDPDLAALLGREARLQAKAAEAPDGTILIEEGRIAAPDIDLTASGTYARPTGAADLDLSFAARPGLAAPFDGVDFAEAGFNGTLSGAPGSYRARGGLRLAGLATAPADVGSAELEIDFLQADGAMRLDVAGGTEGLRLDKIAAEVIGPARLDIGLELAGTALTLARAGLESEVLKIDASGTADIESLDADLDFALSTARLDQVAGAYGVEAAGTISADAALVRRDGVTEIDAVARLAAFRHPLAEAGRLELTAALRQDGAVTGFSVAGDGERLRIDRLGPDLLGAAVVSAEGRLEGDRLELDSAALTSGLVTARASGTLDMAEVTGAVRYDLSLPRVGPAAARYDLPLEGGVEAGGDAVLTAGVPRVDGELGIRGLRWQGERHGDIRLTHDVVLDADPDGTLALDLRHPIYGAAVASTAFALAQPELALDGLDLRALGLRASGDLRVDIERLLAEGRIALNAPDLRPLSRLAGQPASGNARGTIRLGRSGGRQSAQADLDATGVAVGDLRIARAGVSGRGDDLLGQPRVRAALSAGDVLAGDLALGRAELTAAGVLSALDIAANAEGELDGKTLSARTRLRADVSGPTQRAEIPLLEAALADDRVALLEPLRVVRSGGATRATGLVLGLPGEARLAGDVSAAPAGFAGELTLTAPDLARLTRIAGGPVEAGALTAEATFDTRRAVADVAMAATGLRFADIDAAGALDIDARGDWKGRRATLGGTVSGSFGDPVVLEAEVPVARGAIPALARRGPVSGSVTWAGRIDDLWALVPAAGHVLSGEADIDLGVGGDISAPDLTGGATIREGGYQNLDLGTILTDLELATALEPGGALGLTLTAGDGAAGRVETKGRIAFDGSGIELKTTLDRAVLVRRDDARVRLGGNVDVIGPTSALEVTGKIDIDGAEIRLVNANPPSIADLGDVRIKGAERAEEEAGSSSVRLDLSIGAPGRIFVRGRGLDSEWRADLGVRGDAARPVVTGEIERVRGRLDLIGKGFDLETGRIIFDGGRKIDPRIDVVLERTTPDLTGRIVVSGTGSDPKLGFSSTPALPEDEVLPRTLFGKSSQALTPSQGISLGLGLATLMDGDAGTLDAVRSSAGLDSLRVEQDAAGNPSIAAGKEVAEGVWVGTRQAIGEGGTSVAVEIDVFDNVTIDAEAGTESGSSVGLQWRKDF